LPINNETDISTGMAFAMDLTPLIYDLEQDVLAYIMGFIDRFSEDITERYARLGD